MSHKDRHYKSSSQSRQSDDERKHSSSSSHLTCRTVIYEQPTTNKTLKSSVRQVVQPSSFYNTSTTNNSKSLTINNGKQSTAINTDFYNSEIVDDDEQEEEEEEEGEMICLSSDQDKKRNSSEEQSNRRRRRHRHCSSESRRSDDNSYEEKPKERRKRRKSSVEQRSASEEGESISNESDDEERQSTSPNEKQEIDSSTDELNEGEEEESALPQPGRSRFDDNEEEEDRRHKRSRRDSSSTVGSSSSSSIVTQPMSNELNSMEKDVPEEKCKLPNYYPAIQGCRRVDEYKCLNRIEEGTYGVVFRAKDIKTEEIVALKRLKMEKEKEGFPITSLREICCILKSQHENVCTVREIVVGDDMNRIFIVMDYVEHDLKSLMSHTMKKPFLIGQVKTLMYQLLAGVNHLHDNWIIHRDLKTSNLLLSNKGILKIGDFGLAREYGSPLKAYTPVVVTLWYRAPELLLGIKEYSTPIDIWSVGTIFGEFLLMKPLFPGKSELDQLNRIFKDLGTPNEKIWEDYNNLPFTKKMNFSTYPFNRLRTRFDATLSEKGFDLLNNFLAYDPKKRISANNALKHPYFDESPRRIDPSMFPTWPSRNEEKEKINSTALQRTSGSNTATLQNEPKPPSAGKMYEKLLGGGDDESYSIENYLPPPSGFQLRG